MSITEIILIGIGLAMDAFAVSVCKGLSMRKLNLKKGLIISTYFGLFQGLMPTIGYILGTSFEKIIIKIDHWIVFALLLLLGINMLKEALSQNSESNNDKVDFKTMIVLALATSIDALAIGITFAFLRVKIISSALIITTITFVLSFIGVTIGNKFGNKYEKKAQVIGGLILILMGIKILLEHLEIF